MTATELLPCPFCKRPPATNPVAQDAWCAYHTQAMSYKAWNRRSQPEPTMSAEEVREACARICETWELILTRPEHPTEKTTRQITEVGCRAVFAGAIRDLDLSRKEKAK